MSFYQNLSCNVLLAKLMKIVDNAKRKDWFLKKNGTGIVVCEIVSVILHPI